MLTTFFCFFLVVVLNTQAKIAKINHSHPPTLPRPAKVSLLPLLGGALTTYPYKLRPPPTFLARACAPPGYACVQV